MFSSKGYLRALQAIEEKHGGILRPRDVVDEARDENNVLHNYFEWDDAKAADEHRLWQARQLITYEFQTVESKEPEQVYFSLPSQREKPDGGYFRIDIIEDDPLKLEELKKEAARELRRVNEKYRKIAELGAVRKVSESFIQRYFPSFQVSANSGM